MYRDGKQLLTHKEHRFLLTHGALGDMITSLPALIHARSQLVADMHLKVYVAPWQVDLVKLLLAPYGEFDVRPMTEVPLDKKAQKAWRGEASTSMNTATHNTHTRNRVHMVDYAFAFLTDSKPETMAQRNYPTAPLGPRPTLLDYPYVVFPIGATSDNKLFRASVMAPVIEWVFSRGFVPVLVGTKTSHTRAEMGDGELSEPLVIRDEVDKLPADLVKCCVDMREQTTLIELRDVLGHAEAVVGVDGGTLHLAGTTDVSIVYASGTTLPKHRYIARNADPSHKIRYVGPRDLECTGCQSNWPLSRLDFRFCAYKDNACMGFLHPDDFTTALQQLGL